jgi:DNA-binding transcriptional LysR family regulator
MRVDDLLLFAQVVKLKSFRAAASHKHIANSVVSKHICRLEMDMGLQLLYRTTRSLRLTEAGKKLYKHCQLIEKQVNMAEAEMNNYKSEPSGLLRISAPGVSGQLFLPKVINRYAKRYPRVQVEMVIQDSFDDLVEQGFDLAIRTGELEDSSLVAKRLVTSSWRAFASTDYIVDEGFPETLNDLQRHNCLIYSYLQGKESDWPCVSKDGQGTVEVNSRIKVNSLLSLYNSAIDGLGIAFLPAYLVNSNPTSDKLVPILENELLREVGIYALYPKSQFLAPKTRCFIDLLSEMFDEEASSFLFSAT